MDRQGGEIAEILPASKKKSLDSSLHLRPWVVEKRIRVRGISR
jgi:hypothetical protein